MTSTRVMCSLSRHRVRTQRLSVAKINSHRGHCPDIGKYTCSPVRAQGGRDMLSCATKAGMGCSEHCPDSPAHIGADADSPEHASGQTTSRPTTMWAHITTIGRVGEGEIAHE